MGTLSHLICFFVLFFLLGGIDGDQQFYDLVILACDNGTPMLCGNSSVHIIAFGRSSGLHFDPSPYSTDVCFHNAVSGMTLVQLIATHRDLRLNAEVSYSLILKSSTLFDVNSSTGQVILVRTPRTTDVGSDNLFYVEASDGSMAAHTVGMIRIIDCTEHTFYFSSPFYHIQIYEGHRTFTGGRSTVEIGLSHMPMNVFFFDNRPTNPFTNTLNVRLKINKQYFL